MAEINGPVRILSTYVELPEGFLHPNAVGLHFDRSELAAASPSVARVLLGNMVASAFPDRRCVCLYSERRWSGLRQILDQIPNDTFEQRKIRRIALGLEAQISVRAPFIVPVTLQSYARLTGDDLLLVEGPEYVEIWSATQWRVANGHRADWTRVT
jgi:DNA-binding transcriptional regulator/RsmH inhibitor MraZ